MNFLLLLLLLLLLGSLSVWKQLEVNFVFGAFPPFSIPTCIRFSFLLSYICIFVFAFEFLYLSLGLPWPPEAAYGIIGGMGTPWRAKTFVPQNLNASPPDQNGLYFSHTSLKSFVSQFFVQLNSHPNDDGKSYSNKGEPDDDNDKDDDENVKRDD